MKNGDVRTRQRTAPRTAPSLKLEKLIRLAGPGLWREGRCELYGSDQCNTTRCARASLLEQRRVALSSQHFRRFCFVDPLGAVPPCQLSSSSQTTLFGSSAVCWYRELLPPALVFFRFEVFYVLNNCLTLYYTKMLCAGRYCTSVILWGPPWSVARTDAEMKLLLINSVEYAIVRTNS